MVNDASPDDARSTIKKLAQNDSRVKGITYLGVLVNIGLLQLGWTMLRVSG